MKYKTKLEALNALAEFDGHDLLTPEFARAVAEPFETDPVIRRFQDKRSEFKGLRVPSIKEGEWIEGSAAYVLAMSLCSSECLNYSRFHGIGSQFDHCLKVLKEHLAVSSHY